MFSVCDNIHCYIDLFTLKHPVKLIDKFFFFFLADIIVYETQKKKKKKKFGCES